MKTVIRNGKETPFGVDVVRPWPMFPGNGQVLPTLITLHWSATLSAQDTYNVLRKRSLGCHFTIDTDGTVAQTGDLAYVQWTCRGVNHRQIGVEVSNPYYLKYQNPSRPRPVWTLGVNGDKSQHLGFYETEIAATVGLCKSICDLLSIPKYVPVDKSGAPLARTMQDYELSSYNGIVGHYHVNRDKIDPGATLFKLLLDAGFQGVVF